jgi:glutaredoxin
MPATTDKTEGRAGTAHGAGGPPSRRSWLVLGALVLGVGGLTRWWGARHDVALGERLAALAQPGDIRMLSSITCPICTVARRWFEQQGVAHSECFIERDAACRAEFQARQAAGTPLMVVRGVPLLGFDPAQMLAVMERSR